jgi:peptidylprolyl isomerase
MQTVKSGDTVRIMYEMKLENGTTIDSSQISGPKTIIVGEGETFRPIAEALIGMAVGESKTVDVPSSEAYGPRDEGRVFQFPRSRAPKGFDAQVGKTLEMHRADGQKVSVTVLAKSEESYTMDGNHPLAGKNLVFDIALIEILPGV